ncbi:hypothetical protein [Staphylococcus phage vB_SurM-PSU4]|nr:hypothetical protein [Staphylococcus phage vB_SurM-PSU4]
MNTIREFLETREAQGTLHIGDLAEYGVMNVGHNELMYNEDILNFFKQYEDDIEAVILEYVEDLTHDTFYDIINVELMELLNSEINTSFTEYEDMLDLMQDEATQLAETHEDWYDIDEEEQEELIFDCMNDVEVLPTDQDKINFVCLAVELVAQDMTEG